jgi:hypothetical protein
VCRSERNDYTCRERGRRRAAVTTLKPG